MSAFLHQALKASSVIIATLQRRDSSLYEKHTMGAGGDISIGADLYSERIYKEHLLTLASIESEESGFIQGAGSDYIVLDPLDGSDNFLSHIPYYGASLALCDKNGKCKEALIINFCSKECVIRQDSQCFRFYLYEYESKQDKAFMPLDSTPISKCGIFEKAYSNPHIAKLLYENGLKFRSLGASALSMAKAYEVNFMLFMGEIRKFDSKAGLFLCENLHHISSKNWTLISKDKHIFDIILNFLDNSKG